MHVSKSRVVIYSFNREGVDAEFDFNCEERLAKAKADGVITNYDDGRNVCPWFEGPPGKAIRLLRNEFKAADERRQKSQ